MNFSNFILIYFIILLNSVCSQTITSVQLTGVNSFPEQRILSYIKSRWSTKIDSGQISQDCNTVTEFYREEGFLESNCTFTIRSARSNETAILVFDVTEGALYRFGNIDVDGVRAVHPSFIANLTDFSSGMPFSKERILRSQLRAMQTGLFEDFEITARHVEQIERRISVEIFVKEKSGSALDFGIGYDSEDGVKVFSEWKKRNLNGRGRSLALNGLSAVNYNHSLYFKKGSIGLSLREPFFMDLAFDAGLNLRYVTDKPKYVNFGFESYSAELFFDFPISLEYHLILKSRIQTARLFNIPFEQEGRSFQDRFQIDNNRFLSATFTRDSRDDLVDPSDGSYLSLMLEKAGGMLGGDNDYIKFYFLGSVYTTPHRKIVLAQQISAGSIELNTDIESLPSYLRFFLGGSGSVRGFPLRSLGPRNEDGSAAGGNFLLLGNFEIRYYLSYNLSIVSFLDAGNVWIERKNAKLSTLNLASGAGIRYRTQFGLFRLDFGVRLSDFLEKNWGRIHFGFGQSF
jgi:outer membrane translocation and assembly module TamA